MLGSGIVSKKKRPGTFKAAVRDQWIRLHTWLKASIGEALQPTREYADKRRK